MQVAHTIAQGSLQVAGFIQHPDVLYFWLCRASDFWLRQFV